MNNIQKTIKSFYDNSLEIFDLSKKEAELKKEFRNFVQDEVTDNIFSDDDEGFVYEIAPEIIMELAEKDNLEDFLNKVKEFKKSINEVNDEKNDLKQQNFLILKQAEEFSASNMDIDIICIDMNKHPKWHKIQKDIEELSKEKNFSTFFTGGKAYMATYPLEDKTPTEYLTHVLKNSETKGNFLRSIFKESNAVSKLDEESSKNMILSNGKLIDLKCIQMAPKLFSTDIMESIKDTPETRHSSKNKI